MLNSARKRMGSSMNVSKPSKFKNMAKNKENKSKKKNVGISIEDIDIFTIKSKLETIIQDKYQSVIEMTEA